MKDIKVTKDCYIPKESIKFYIAYETHTVKDDVRKKRKEGKVYDFTSGKKIASVIYLKSGELVLTNTGIITLNKRMEEET